MLDCYQNAIFARYATLKLLMEHYRHLQHPSDVHDNQLKPLNFLWCSEECNRQWMRRAQDTRNCGNGLVHTYIFQRKEGTSLYLPRVRQAVCMAESIPIPHLKAVQYMLVLWGYRRITSGKRLQTRPTSYCFVRYWPVFFYLLRTSFSTDRPSADPSWSGPTSGRK